MLDFQHEFQMLELAGAYMKVSYTYFSCPCMLYSNLLEFQLNEKVWQTSASRCWGRFEMSFKECISSAGVHFNCFLSIVTCLLLH